MYQNDFSNEAGEQKEMFLAYWIFLDILMKTEEHFVDWMKYRVQVPEHFYELN